MKLLLPIGLALVLASCDMLDTPEKMDRMEKTTSEMKDTTKDMDQTTQDMHETTKEMSETTKDMGKTTKDMQSTTEKMKDSTNSMFLQFRSKESQESRERAFKRLNNSRSFNGKVSSAAIYFQSFEFNLWTLADFESDQERLELLHIATREFFRDIHELYDEFENPEELSAIDDDNLSRSLFALAVAMHEVHHYQKSLISTKGVKKFSFLQIITDTLYKLENINQGMVGLSGLQEFEIEILENENIAKNLLLYRYKMLPTMILSEVSGITKHTGTIRKAKMLTTGWESKFETLSLVNKHKIINKYFHESLRLKSLLPKLGIAPKLDKKVIKFFKKMKAPKVGRNKINTALQEELALNATFYDYLKELLK